MMPKMHGEIETIFLLGMYNIIIIYVLTSWKGSKLRHLDKLCQ